MMNESNKDLSNDQAIFKKVEVEMRDQGKCLLSEIPIDGTFHFSPDGFTWTLRKISKVESEDVSIKRPEIKYSINSEIDSKLRVVSDFWIFDGDSPVSLSSRIKEGGKNAN